MVRLALVRALEGGWRGLLTVVWGALDPPDAPTKVMYVLLCTLMQRTTIMIPSDLKARSQTLARRLGISFGELTREALEAFLRGFGGEVREDPLFDLSVYRGEAQVDLSERHDDYLYDAEE